MAATPLSRFTIAEEIKNKKNVDSKIIDPIIRNAVEQTYLNARNPGSYSSVSGIVRIVKDKLPQYSTRHIIDITKQILSEKPSYYLNVQPKTQFLRSRIYSGGLNYMFDTDLMNLYPFSRHNKGFKYVLVVIDIFSRFALTRGVKSKGHNDVVPAMDSILQERKCKILRSDAGGEFTNHHIKALYKKHNIKHYIAYNDGKASYGERCIKSLKNKIIRYLTANNTYKWIDVLQDITYSYNNTIHSTLKRKPSSITKDNEDEVYNEQYNSISQSDIKKAIKRSDNIRRSMEISTGDYVRLSKVKNTFQKEYENKWTRELFQVYKTSVRDGCVVFYIRDLLGEEIRGSFYRQQLQKAMVRDTDLYQYEKVIGRKTVKGRKYYQIRWAYYSKKFDEWVTKQQFSMLKKVLI